MTLLEHLEELRKRLFIALIAWVVGAAVAFYFRFELLNWLSAPLPGNLTLHYFSILEPFVVSMQISAFFGLVIASPVIGSQVWGFIAPGLYPEERRWAVPFIVLTTLAFAAGVAFARFVVLPFALPILLAFLGDAAAAVLSIGDFISKMLLYMAVFGIIFEMPVLGFLLAKLGLLQASMLRQYRRHAIVAGLLIAAVITPTGDPFNFALVGVPLVVLYEVSILVVRLSQRKVERGSKDPEFTSPN